MRILRPARRPRRLLCGLLGAILTLGILTETPVYSASFEANKVVVHSVRNDHGRNTDVWGFVGTDGREYVIQGVFGGTVWWDIHDPAAPVLVTELPGPGSRWRDTFVIGNHAYIVTEGGGGMQIVDISDPTNPTLATTYVSTFNNAHNVFGDPSRNLLFVVGSGNTTQGPLHIFNVSSPTIPVLVHTYSAGGYVHDVSLEGTTLHLNHIYAGKVSLLDITTPSAPLLLAGFTDPIGWSHSSWPLGDGVHLAIAEETNGGHVKILDISDPGAISIASVINPFPVETAHNPHVEGNLLFVAWNAVGARIFDVSTPTAPVEIASLDTSPPEDYDGIYSGNWGIYPHLPSGVVAATDRLQGLHLFEVAPTAAVVRGVVEDISGNPIEGGDVTISGIGITEVTDATGAFEFSVFPGAQTVFASHPLYTSDSTATTVADSDTVAVVITLETTFTDVPELASATSTLRTVPNPISEDARVSFVAPHAGQGEVAVLDVQGRRRLTLFEGPVERGVRKSMDLDSRGLPSGVYFVQLRVEHSVWTEKIVVYR